MQHAKTRDRSQRADLERVFPIVDVPSALLMRLKARCVLDAGAITPAEFDEVDRRAEKAISAAERAEAKAPA